MKFFEVLDIINGRNQKQVENPEGKYPIYGSGGVMGYADDYICEANTVIIGRKGSINNPIYVDRPFWNVDTAFGLVAHKEVLLPKYLYYFCVNFNFEQLSTTVTIPSLTKANLLQIEIAVPSIEKQGEIVAVLDKVSALIELSHKQLEKIDELVKSRFIEMFVTTNDVNDWVQTTIADVSTDMRTGPFGSALHHDEFVDSGVFVLGIDNAVENKFSYNRMRYITEDKYRQLKRYTVYPGDVIITIMGTVGRSAVIPKDMPKAINTKHLACITPNTALIDSTFLSSAFQMHPSIRLQLQNQSKGAIMDGLNLTIIKALRFALPPLDLQQQFATFVEQVDKSKVVMQQSLEKLETLKKSLMQKYFG